MITELISLEKGEYCIINKFMKHNDVWDNYVGIVYKDKEHKLYFGMGDGSWAVFLNGLWRTAIDIRIVEKFTEEKIDLELFPCTESECIIFYRFIRYKRENNFEFFKDKENNFYKLSSNGTLFKMISYLLQEEIDQNKYNIIIKKSE